MSKAKITFILVFSIMLASFQPAQAAWWQKQDIETPPVTRETKKQAKKFAERDMLYTYYESNLDIASLRDFYRRKLPALGWKEKPLKEQFEQYISKQINPDKRYLVFLDYNLMFEKGDKELIISFLPEDLSKGEKTKFTTAETSKKTNEQYLQEDASVPVLLTKPKKNITPEFPGANLVFLSETDTSMKATYSSYADAEQVLLFYKENMPKYNWSLTQEIPFTQVEAGDLFKDQNTMPQPTGLKDMYFAELAFNNKEGDTCTIGIIRSEFMAQAAPKGDLVNIRVSYEKKH